MSKRVTLVLDDVLVKKLRNIQAKKIIKSKEHVSFSGIVNDTLCKCLK